jgi:hypothetical protein
MHPFAASKEALFQPMRLCVRLLCAEMRGRRASFGLYNKLSQRSTLPGADCAVYDG